MKIMINHNTMTPIYEQLVGQIKTAIVDGELLENEPLPSVRMLAKELKISALTVKKAYDQLEGEGFTRTIHGKGTFVLPVNASLKQEEILLKIQASLEKVITEARMAGVSKDEVRALIDIILED